MGGAILPQSVASGAGLLAGMMILVQGSPWDRRRSPLLRLGPVFKVPISLAFLFPPKGTLLPVGPWACQSLFGGRAHAFGLLVCFHSSGVRGGMSTGLEILVLKQLSLLPFTFSFENKRKQYLLNLFFVPNMGKHWALH